MIFPCHPEPLAKDQCPPFKIPTREAQIKKGEELLEKWAKIIRELSPDTTMRTRSRDNFEVIYNQWRDFAEDKLRELFVSSHYADEFREARSSEVEYVSSDWIPGVDY